MDHNAVIGQVDSPVSSPDSKGMRKRVSSVIQQYHSRHDAKNSARSAKPSFSNIEKELRELALRKRAFKEEIDKALRKLGDMRVFEKYRRRKEWSRGKERGEEGEKRQKLTALSISVVPEDLPLIGDHRRLRSQDADLPSTTRTATFPSPVSKFSPTHQDQRVFFALNRTATAGEQPSAEWTQLLETVVKRCKEVENTQVDTRKETVDSTRAALKIAFLRYEKMTDVLDTLKTHDPSCSFSLSLSRRRASKNLRHSLLSSAAEVKKSFLDTSEFVAKHAHKEIWRFSSLSLARHADKLINSLPITRGAVKGK